MIVNFPSGDWQAIFVYDKQSLTLVFDHHSAETDSVAKWAQDEVWNHYRTEDVTPALHDEYPIWQEDLLEFFYDNFGVEEEVVLSWSDFAKWPQRPAPEPELTVIQQGNLIAELQERLRQANEQLDWDGRGKY